MNGTGGGHLCVFLHETGSLIRSRSLRGLRGRQESWTPASPIWRTFMTVSPFSTLCLTSAPTSNPAVVVFMNCELVRGVETQIVEELLPRVRQHSLALDLSGVERIDAAGIASLITLY